MDRPANRADAALAMTTMLRNLQRAGRFGREVRGDDVQTDDTRTTIEKEGAGERFEMVGYMIDADAVAAAIVDRLIAGGTLRVP